MAGDKTGNDDLFEQDVFSIAIKGAEQLYAVFEKLENKVIDSLKIQKEFFTSFKGESSQNIKDLNKELKDQAENLKNLNGYEKAKIQALKEIEKLEQEKLKTSQQSNKAQKESIKTEIEYQKLQKIANAETKKLTGEYQKQSKILRDLKTDYKNVALAQGENSKAAKDLLAQITPLDAKLKQIDKNTGESFRNVGNYQSALANAGKTAQNILGAAGITVGLSAGIDFIKDSVAEFSKFETAVANLSAITGASGKDLEFFKDQAKELGIDVKGGAAAVIEAYKLIGGAKPELLENGEALNYVTKEAIKLSQATGLELPDAAKRLTDALNQFGAPAEQAGKYVDILAAASKAGAAEVPEVTDALLKFGVAAKSSNITIQESAAAIEVLADKGIKGSMAGEKLNVIFTKLAAAKVLPKEALAQLSKAGVDIEKLSDKTLPLNERLKELSKISGDAGAIVKVFGLENQQAGQILLENIPRLEQLTAAVDQNGIAALQAATNTETFAFRQQRLGNTFDALKANVGEYLVNYLNPLFDAYDLLSDKISIVDQQLKKTADKRQEIAQLVAGKSIEDQKKFLEQVNQDLKGLEANKGSLSATQYEAERKTLILTRQAYLDLLTAKAKDRNVTKENTEDLNNNTKATDKNTESKKKNKKIQFDTFENAIKLQNEELRKDQEELDYEYAKNKKEREAKENEEQYAEALKLQDDLLKADDERLAAEEKARKEAKEKQLKDIADTANKAIDVAANKIAKEQELINSAIDAEINKRNSAIDEQKRRAEQGMSNTLAFEEKALKDAEAKKQNEAKQAEKREKTLAFFKLLTANAEKDPDTALTKTLTEILLADAIAGAFFTGTEKVENDLKGNKVHNGRDGYRIAVDGKERILTGDQNDKIGDLTNDQLAQLAYSFNNNELLPNYVINQALPIKSTGENLYGAMQLNELRSVNDKLSGLEKAIKNIPGTDFNIDDKFFTKKRKQNGFEVITKKPLGGGYYS